MKRKKYMIIGRTIFWLIGSWMILAGLQRLFLPKYMGRVIEGNFTREYYQERETLDSSFEHDVLFLGNCEVYENISPIALWREYGITSYIRGNAQQLIAQSYHLLEDTLRYETPKAVVFSILSMKQFEQDTESYNRMTMDGMRWSLSKWDAIMETKMEGEHMTEYIFPLLRFHTRWKDLGQEDILYFFQRGTVTHNGYYMRADVRPPGDLPTERRLADYSFDKRCWEYLDKIRVLCEKRQIQLILFKAPAVYPTWHEEWEEQVVEYAREYDLVYINGNKEMDEIGIDLSQDTYDQGLHLNVYGAEKMAEYLGRILLQVPGVCDKREDPEISVVWEKKSRRYEKEKAQQEAEFAELGYLKRFYQEH